MNGELEWLQSIAFTVNPLFENKSRIGRNLESDRIFRIQEILQGKTFSYNTYTSRPIKRNARPKVVQVLFPTPDTCSVEYVAYDINWQHDPGSHIPAYLPAYVKELHHIGILAKGIALNRWRPNITTQDVLEKHDRIDEIVKRVRPEYPVAGIVHFHVSQWDNRYNEYEWGYFALQMVRPQMYPELAEMMMKKSGANTQADGEAFSSTNQRTFGWFMSHEAGISGVGSESD